METTLKEVMWAPGRSTGMGAVTHLIVLRSERGKAKVVQFNVSRSGNHWEEKLYITDDFSGEVALKDVSNSGKHRCVLYVFENGKIKETVQPEGYWPTPCPVCKRIRKRF